MAILVDELREYPDARLPFKAWCHMATDGAFEELHEFAGRLGLRRAWFQRDHYDLPAHGRAAAVALGAEEVATGELLLRMAGPRGERARRRVLEPAGVAWLRGSGGPAMLRYPAGALVVIGGPPGAGKSTLAARVVESVPVLDPDDALAALGPGGRWDEALATWRAQLRSSLSAGGGAVAVTTALRDGHRRGLARAASGAGAAAHLLMLDADASLCRAGRAAQGEPRIADGLFEHLLREWQAFRRALVAASDPAPFASITVLDREAADRLRRIDLSLSTRD
jgi:predicted kinase